MFTGLGGFRGVILAFSAGDLSRINIGGGVAPERTQYAAKTLFSLITAPIRFKTVGFRLCRHVCCLISSDTKPTRKNEEELRRRSLTCWQVSGIKITRHWACLYINKSNAVSWYIYEISRNAHATRLSDDLKFK